MVPTREAELPDTLPRGFYHASKRKISAENPTEPLLRVRLKVNYPTGPLSS